MELGMELRKKSENLLKDLLEVPWEEDDNMGLGMELGMELCMGIALHLHWFQNTNPTHRMLTAFLLLRFHRF
jgi:hypothetical protein